MKKMNTDERHSHIRKLAFDYARSGKYIDWLSVEHALRSDGFSEARSILDNQYIREELNQICKDAHSPSEIENRELFKNWIKDFIQDNITNVKEKYAGVSIDASENSFTIFSSKKEIEITKVFYSRKLQGDYYEESGDHRYKYGNNYHSIITFEQFTIDDLYNLAEKVI